MLDWRLHGQCVGRSTNSRGSKNISRSARPGVSPTLIAKRNKTVGHTSTSTTRDFHSATHGDCICTKRGVSAGRIASGFAVSMLQWWDQVDFSACKHPLCIYIPKSESADEALWWRDPFQMICAAQGRTNPSKMALVRVHRWLFSDRKSLRGISRPHAGMIWPLGLHASVILNRENPDGFCQDRNTIDTTWRSSRICAISADICQSTGCWRSAA